jgi:hypothetical protein
MPEQVGVFSRFPKNLDGLTYTAEGRNLKVGYDFEDFITSVVSPSNTINKYTVAISGAGAIVITGQGGNDRPGFGIFDSGTTTTGRAQIYLGGTNADGLNFGAGVYTFETDIFLANLSTAGEEYGFSFGFGDNTALDMVDGVYFKYNRLGTGVNWRLMTSKASARTDTDSGVIVTAGVWHRFKIIINALATSVAFYIDNILVGTITTNIPDAATKLGVIMGILKSAGTTNRLVYCDWIWFHYDLTVSR